MLTNMEQRSFCVHYYLHSPNPAGYGDKLHLRLAQDGKTPNRRDKITR